MAALSNLNFWTAAASSPSPPPADVAPVSSSRTTGDERTGRTEDVLTGDEGKYLAALEQNLALQACRMELRQMLTTIQKNCAEQIKSPQPLQLLTVDLSQDVLNTTLGQRVLPSRGPFTLRICSEQTIAGSVATPQRLWGKQLPDLLREVPHVAMYPFIGLKEPPQGRRTSLQALLGTPPLRITRWLIVTAPDDIPPSKAGGEDAHWRLRWATRFLLDKKVRPASIEPAWLYDLHLGDVAGIDSPMVSEAQSSSKPKPVFIFRLNC